MQLSPKTVDLSLRVSPDLKEAVVKAAKAQHRSLTSFIEVLVLAHLDKTKRKDKRDAD